MAVAAEVAAVAAADAAAAARAEASSPRGLRRDEVVTEESFLREVLVEFKPAPEGHWTDATDEVSLGTKRSPLDPDAVAPLTGGGDEDGDGEGPTTPDALCDPPGDRTA